MYHYIIPFLFYVVTIPLIKYEYLLAARVLILFFFIFLFRKHYKFRLKFDLFSILIGIVIFLSWTLLEGKYIIFGTVSFVPSNNFSLFVRLLSFVVIAPFIEEFFTRNFLARVLVSNKWRKVPLGKFTYASFAVTVAFFGFSHNRWLPGIVAGILLNYLIYKKKDMNSVVTAHVAANLLLSIYIVATHSWFLW